MITGRHKAAGYVQITDPIKGVIELETRHCMHCSKHWIYKPGSGITRGFCLNCMGLTCGAKQCDPCIPFERRLEAVEKGISKFL